VAQPIIAPDLREKPRSPVNSDVPERPLFQGPTGSKGSIRASQPPLIL